MKKRSIITCTLAFAMTAALSACGSSSQQAASQSKEKTGTEQQAASSSESQEKPDTERFEEILAENTLDSILSRHDNMLMECEIRQSDGSSSDFTYYFDADTEFLAWDKVNLCYISTPESYIEYKTDKDEQTWLLCDDTDYYQQIFEEYREEYPIYYYEHEVLEKTGESDGLFRAYTTTKDEEEVNDYLTIYLDDGYQKGMICFTEYVFDSDSNDFLSFDDKITAQDGTEYFSQVGQCRYDVDIDGVDDILSDYLSKEKETRTITLTFASGTDREHTETFKIAPDAFFCIYENGEEMEICYTDPECTQMYQSDSNEGKDLHLYLKS